MKDGPLKSMLICKYQNKPIFIRIKGDIGDIDSPATSWKSFSKGKPKSGKLSAFFIQKKINSSYVRYRPFHESKQESSENWLTAGFLS